MFVSKLIKKHSKRKEKKRIKWVDPYNVEGMSDAEFSLNKDRIIKSASVRVGFGLIFFVLVMITLLYGLSMVDELTGWFL